MSLPASLPPANPSKAASGVEEAGRMEMVKAIFDYVAQVCTACGLMGVQVVL